MTLEHMTVKVVGHHSFRFKLSSTSPLCRQSDGAHPDLRVRSTVGWPQHPPHPPGDEGRDGNCVVGFK